MALVVELWQSLMPNISWECEIHLEDQKWEWKIVHHWVSFPTQINQFWDTAFFFQYMPMCSPRNAAQFDTCFGVPDTRCPRVAHWTFARTDFSRSASCWRQVHDPRFRAPAGEFPTGSPADSGRASSPVLFHPVAALPSASPDPTIPTVWEWRNLLDWPDSATFMVPNYPKSGLDRPRELTQPIVNCIIFQCLPLGWHILSFSFMCIPFIQILSVPVRQKAQELNQVSEPGEQRWAGWFLNLSIFKVISGTYSKLNIGMHFWSFSCHTTIKVKGNNPPLTWGFKLR